MNEVKGDDSLEEVFLELEGEKSEKGATPEKNEKPAPTGNMINR